LLDRLGADDVELVAVRRLLSTLGTVPSLTLLAGYLPRSGAPEWDVAYPEDSEILQLVSHDSAKRPDSDATALVMQARPAWSRRNGDQPVESWSAAILAETERLLGRWAGAPSWTQSHHWRYARLDAGAELAAPIVLPLGGGARLGLAGEVFSPGGGVQGAFVSGRRLAHRLSRS
jgi:hypothetical protein